MKEEKEIISFFNDTLEDIDDILKSDFYHDKANLKEIREKIERWYKNFIQKKSLVCIEPQELKQLDLDITTIFADYVATEPVKENYTERLLYDFGHLEKYWKDEMLGGNKNVR